MKSEFIQSLRGNFFIRKTLMIFVGLAVAIFLFWYVNTYIYKFFASTDPVSVSMTPTKETIDLSGKSHEEFNVAFQVANQDVSGMELILTYDSKYLQYGKEYDTTGGFIQPENFQYDVLIEEVSELDENTKQVKLVLVATTEIPATPNNSRLLNFKFKAIAVDPADSERIDNVIQNIRLNTQSQFVGANNQGEAAQFGNPTEPVLASVTIYRGTGSDLTPTATVAPDDPTPTGTISGPRFVFEPSSTSVKKNETFNINLTIDPGSEQVAGADIYLTYNANLLTIDQVTAGSYFPLVSNVPATGRIYISATVATQGESKTGSGTIATITFKAIETGNASITVDCDPSKTDTSRIIKNDIDATNVLVCEALQAHTVTITAASEPSPTPTSDDVPTPTPTTGNFSGEKADVQLNMKVRFQGVVKQPNAAFDRLNVRIDIEGSQGYKNDQIVEFKADGSGLWNGVMKIEDVPIAQKYAVLIKGPKHLSRKICQAAPRENVPGTYKCESGGDIELKEGGNNLDFSQIVVLAGDIPTQNQVVDSADIIFIRQNFGNTSPTALSRGDLNLDGIIDTQDYSLVMAALGFKYDEEL
ncbi:hypothetical protein IPM65_03920 [Candidatus Roizmanbacteria bacterium]|nr:MAG: hypothetical protein IPM65_03920 [Candidatus Roizmanbacteria bacterium]